MDQRDRDVLTARFVARASIFALFSLAAATGHAGPKDATVYPTVVEVTPGHYAPAATADDQRAREASVIIDATLLDTAGDLGLTAKRGGPEAFPPLTKAPADWLIVPRLVLEPDAVRVKLVAVAPGSRVELAREERLTTQDLSTLEVRTVVMLRDVFDAGNAPERETRSDTAALPEPPAAPPSSGRPVLALNSVVLGGYFGFTIQRASGSRDTRLVYPLVALGAGLGLGASLLVADEWDVTTGDAWYLSAGMWWPAASGLLLAEGYGVKPDLQFTYSLLAAIGGAGLATTAITLTGSMSDGDAVLAHSGGGFGALFGAMVEMGYRGETAGPITRGLGWGAATGVVTLGTVATVVDVSASRVLLVDLATSLGGLLGAAAASPLLLVDETDATRTRLWLASAGAGAVGGAVVGWMVTGPGKLQTGQLPFLPYVTYVPDPRGGTLDAGVTGRF